MSLPDLLVELGPAPDLPGASCVGQAPMFDGDLLPDESLEDRGARLVRAVRCTAPGCPFLTRSPYGRCPLHRPTTKETQP